MAMAKIYLDENTLGEFRKDYEKMLGQLSKASDKYLKSLQEIETKTSSLKVSKFIENARYYFNHQYRDMVASIVENWKGFEKASSKGLYKRNIVELCKTYDELFLTTTQYWEVCTTPGNPPGSASSAIDTEKVKAEILAETAAVSDEFKNILTRYISELNSHAEQNRASIIVKQLAEAIKEKNEAMFEQLSSGIKGFIYGTDGFTEAYEKIGNNLSPINSAGPAEFNPNDSDTLY